MSAEITAIGMVTPVGLSAPASAAAIRAGISGVRLSSHRDRQGHKIPMGLVPSVNGSRFDRLIALGASALGEVMEADPIDEPVTLLLGTPEDQRFVAVVDGAALLDAIAKRSGARVDRASSAAFPSGRAAGIIALREALRRIDAGEAKRVIVGGVDSHAEDALLDRLEETDRLKTSTNMEGIIAGEGAAFLVLSAVGTASAKGRSEPAVIAAASIAEEPGHVGSAAPFLGDGLSAAIRDVFAKVPGARAKTVYAGLTGDYLSGKEWGVASIRAKASFADRLRVEHPVDAVGDPGAALGPLLIGLATIGVARGYRRSPCLVWCSSEGAPRGAALIT